MEELMREIEIAMGEEVQGHPEDNEKPEENTRLSDVVFLRKRITIHLFASTVSQLSGVSRLRTPERKVKRIRFEGKTFLVIPFKYTGLRSCKMPFNAAIELEERRECLFYTDDVPSYVNERDLGLRVMDFLMKFNRFKYRAELG